jgi:hypothetical protein
VVVDPSVRVVAVAQPQLLSIAVADDGTVYRTTGTDGRVRFAKP